MSFKPLKIVSRKRLPDGRFEIGLTAYFKGRIRELRFAATPEALLLCAEQMHKLGVLLRDRGADGAADHAEQVRTLAAKRAALEPRKSKKPC